MYLYMCVCVGCVCWEFGGLQLPCPDSAQGDLDMSSNLGALFSSKGVVMTFQEVDIDIRNRSSRAGPYK